MLGVAETDDRDEQATKLLQAYEYSMAIASQGGGSLALMGLVDGELGHCRKVLEAALSRPVDIHWTVKRAGFSAYASALGKLFEGAPPITEGLVGIGRLTSSAAAIRTLKALQMVLENAAEVEKLAGADAAGRAAVAGWWAAQAAQFNRPLIEAPAEDS